jgi:hypothetical protein
MMVHLEDTLLALTAMMRPIGLPMRLLTLLAVLFWVQYHWRSDHIGWNISWVAEACIEMAHTAHHHQDIEEPKAKLAKNSETCVLIRRIISDSHPIENAKRIRTDHSEDNQNLCLKVNMISYKSKDGKPSKVISSAH